MARIFLAPVHYMGHPFTEMNHELVMRFDIEGHDVYAAGEKFYYTNLSFIPEDGLDAVVCWDPTWTRTGKEEWSKAELLQMRKIADREGVPLVGVLCDWFAGWEHNYRLGTMEALKILDAATIDRAGAAALARYGWDRPAVEMSDYLSYTNLPSLSKEPPEYLLSVPDDSPQAHRPLDVVYIGSEHIPLVALRSFYLNKLEEICQKNGLYYKIEKNLSPNNMESRLLQSKVCFNASLGTGLNMRIYEGAATGCALLTDPWNIENDRIRHFADIYQDEYDLEVKLLALVNDADRRDDMARIGTKWASKRHPAWTWGRIIDTALEAAELAKGGTALVS